MKHYSREELEKNQDGEEMMGQLVNLALVKLIFFWNSSNALREGTGSSRMPWGAIFHNSSLNAPFNTFITCTRGPFNFWGPVQLLQLHVLTYGPVHSSYPSFYIEVII